MHARIVGGSCAVVCLPSREVRPGKPTLETTAAIAVYFRACLGFGFWTARGSFRSIDARFVGP